MTNACLRVDEPPRRSRPRMSDVAALAGVSTSTVSKVVNDRYGVSELTARRVLDAIDRLGYVPDLAATALRGGTTHVVGFFAAELGAWEGAVLRGATAEALSSGYSVCAFVGERVTLAGPGAAGSVARLTGSMVDGAIAVVPEPGLVALDAVPVVVVGAHRGLPRDVVAETEEAEALGRSACARLLRHLDRR